jgi:hypothetical protein
VKLYMIINEPQTPVVRWTEEEAEEAVRALYRGHDLTFEEGSFPNQRIAYDWSAMEGDRAGLIREVIHEMDAPEPPGSVNLKGGSLPEGAAVLMEMRVTTEKGMTSFEHVDTSVIWDSVHLGKGYLIQQFADRAGRSLAAYLTEEST